MNINTLVMASVATKSVYKRFAQLSDEEKADVVNKVKEKLNQKSNGEESGDAEDSEESEDQLHTLHSEEGAKAISDAMNGDIEEETQETEDTEQPAEESTDEAPQEEEGDDDVPEEYDLGPYDDEEESDGQEDESTEDEPESEDSGMTELVNQLAEEVEQIKSDGRVETSEVLGLFDNMMKMVTLLVEAKPKGSRKSSIADRVAMRMAKEFDTKEELAEYLKSHPKADKSKHKVKNTNTDNPKSEEPESKGDAKPEGEDENKSLKEKAIGFGKSIADLGNKIKEGLQNAPDNIKKFTEDEAYRNEQLKKAGNAVKKAPGVIGKAIWESGKKEVKEIAHAGKAVGKLATGQKLDKEDKHALYATSVYVAGTIIGAATGGVGGAALALGHSFKLHVGIKAVHAMADEGFLGFEAFESVHHALDAISHLAAEELSEEERNQQVAVFWAIAAVTKVLEQGIGEEEMQQILDGVDYDDAEKAMDIEFKQNGDKTASIAARVAARGLQVRRKDKDLMSDTGGTSKGREREPEKKPPRDDMKKPHRTKDKTPEQRDKDTDNDKDMKKSAVRQAMIDLDWNKAMKEKYAPETIHPLDRKEEMWGMPMPEQNYYRSVWGSLVDILANANGVSEKSSDYKEVMANAEQILRKAEVMEVVDRFELQEKRPSFCAECVYADVNKA